MKAQIAHFSPLSALLARSHASFVAETRFSGASFRARRWQPAAETLWLMTASSLRQSQTASARVTPRGYCGLTPPPPWRLAPSLVAAPPTLRPVLAKSAAQYPTACPTAPLVAPSLAKSLFARRCSAFAPGAPPSAQPDAASPPSRFFKLLSRPRSLWHFCFKAVRSRVDSLLSKRHFFQRNDCCRREAGLFQLKEASISSDATAISLHLFDRW